MNVKTGIILPVHKVIKLKLNHLLKAPFFAAPAAPFFLADPSLSSALRLFCPAVGEGSTYKENS